MAESLPPPYRIINAIAPTRICDIGGWTDTWFSEAGAVFNIAVHPYAEVQVHCHRADEVADRVTIYAENYDLRYSLERNDVYRHLPLIEAAVKRMTIPDDIAIVVCIHCGIPPGASTGTSAAIAVAVIGALDRLTPGRLSHYDIVRLAHIIEAEDLGLQSGVQDQLCSVYGGINFIQMHRFPHAAVSPLRADPAVEYELEHRLGLIYIGKPHSSSAVHEEVIGRFEQHPQKDGVLQRLQDLAHRAKDAYLSGDFCEFGQIMDENTEEQRRLHPALVSEGHERAVSIAREFGSIGCKVNGAGGDGGSVTVLGDGRAYEQRRMIDTLDKAGLTYLPVTLAQDGLTVWESKGCNRPAPLSGNGRSDQPQPPGSASSSLK